MDAEFQVGLLKDDIRELRREVDAIRAEERARVAARLALSMRVMWCAIAAYAVVGPLIIWLHH